MSDDDAANQSSLAEFGQSSRQGAASSGSEDGARANTAQVAEHIEQLRQAAIDAGWHQQQGKGASESAAIEQDLLAHTMDVVHIAYNLVDALDIAETDAVEMETVLSVAFFHDLHKRPTVGSTVSMTTTEVEMALTELDVRTSVLGDVDLQAFTDVIKSIHQFHGDSDARAATAGDRQLQTLVNIVRLADSIASVENLNGLWGSGWRDPIEPLNGIGKVTGTDWTLGYHQFSTVRPALSTVLHGSIQSAAEDCGAVLLTTTADAAIYLFPVEILTDDTSDSVAQSLASGNSDPFVTKVAEMVRSRVLTQGVRESIPDKLQEPLYGSADALKIRLEEQRQALTREESGPDLQDAVESVAHINSNPGEYDTKRGDVSFLAVEETTNTIHIENPLTERGAVVGESFSQATKILADKKDRIDRVDSRIEILDELTAGAIDLEPYTSLQWGQVQTHLARLAGNHLAEELPKSPSKLIDTVEERASALLGEIDNTEDSETQSLVSVDSLETLILDTVSLAIRDGDATIRPFQSGLPQSITANLDYNDACVLCGQTASTQFRTSRGSPFKKSYLTRGLAGKDMTDTGWNLCDTCYLDNALFRAFAANADNFTNAEDAVFLKVIPNRYLGPAQAALLRQRFREGGAFGSVYEDAQRHLESQYELVDAESFGFADIEQSPFTAEYRVTFDDRPQSGGTSVLIGSPHFLVIAVQDYSETPEKQVTHTWLKALLRALILTRYHNCMVTIDAHPTLPGGGHSHTGGGVTLTNPPSQIRTVFDNHIEFTATDTMLNGLASLIYITGKFPQYEGPEDLQRVYELFRTSLLPGGRLYRSAERELESNTPVGEIIEDCHLLMNVLNEWRSSCGLNATDKTQTDAT